MPISVNLIFARLAGMHCGDRDDRDDLVSQSASVIYVCGRIWSLSVNIGDCVVCEGAVITGLAVTALRT